MRVLYLSASGCLGGAETSLLALLEGLRNLHPDWDLHLLLGENGPLAFRAAALGVAVRLLLFPPKLAAMGSGAFPNGAALPGAALGSFRYVQRLRAVIREIRPDVIHSNGFKMHVLSAWCRAGNSANASALVCHMHDHVSPRGWARTILRACAGRFDAIIANSASVSADLIRLPVPSRLVSTIANGIHTSRFQPVGKKLDLDQLSGLRPAQPGVVRIGLVATFAKWKGHSTFLQAISLLPENPCVRAYVVGGPVYQPENSQYTLAELRAKTATYKLGGKVGFTGFAEDAASAIRSLDIVVHASTRPEPFGMVIVEAMACAKAVIVSDAGGASEIFEEGITALGHKPGDATALACQMERLVRNPELRQRLGEAARAMVAERFPASVTAQRVSDLYCKAGQRNSKESSIAELSRAARMGTGRV